jgi:RNA polymerase-associated protein CTR9
VEEYVPEEDEPDAILLLNTLAAYYVERYTGQQEALLLEATQLITKSEQVNRLDPFTLVIKGLIQIANGKLDAALYTFRGVTLKEKRFIPALAGLAQTYFLKQDYENALEIYQNILKLNPSVVPDVRVSIGVCFAKLSMPDEAFLAFQRALERDPENLTIQMLLAGLESNEKYSSLHKMGTKNQMRKRSLGRIKMCFEKQPKNPLLGIQLAHKFLRLNEFKKATIMTNSALKANLCPALKSEAVCIQARIAHESCEYDKCKNLYQEAVALDSRNLVAHFGLAQMFTYYGDNESACKQFEIVAQKDPNNYETKKMLASLYALSPDTKSKALDYFESLKLLLKSTQNQAEHEYIKDPEMLGEMALLAESESISSALKVYSQLLLLLQELNPDSIAPELLNNIAVLHHLEGYQKDDSIEMIEDDIEKSNAHRNSSLQAAETLYQQALIMVTKPAYASSHESWKVNAIQSTIRFNVACLYETKMDHLKASNQFLELLKIHPADIDSMLRLGIIELGNANFEKALEYFSDALAVDPKHVTSWNLVGHCHLKAKEYRKARKSFEKVLKELDKHDPFALCCMGNLSLKQAKDDPGQKSSHVKRAAEFFCTALRHHPKTLRAAAGLAIAFIYNGNFDEALEILNQCLGDSPNDRQVTLNTANVFAAIGKASSATVLFEAMLKKSNRDIPEMYKALSRCQYIIGKSTLDPLAIKKAQEFAQKAVDLDSTDDSHLFNLALTKQQYAQILNQQPQEKRYIRSIENLKEGLEGLNYSERIFEELAQKEAPIGYSTKQAKERAEFSSALRRVTEKKIHEAEIFQKQRQDNLNDIKTRQLELEREALQKEVLWCDPGRAASGRAGETS